MNASAFTYQPTLANPFPAAIHPQAERIEQQTIRWAEQHGLITTANERTRLERGRFASLMARAYPTAPIEQLQLIADWNTWTFLLDDQFDEHSIGYNPDAVESMHARILSMLAGGAPLANDSARMHALHQITNRLRAQRTEEWMERFQANVRDTLAASLWEARNRQTKLVPSEHDYRYWRLFTSGVYCYFTLIELAHRMTLPARLLEHPLVQKITRSANYVICWSNDLFSLNKELARGDVHNLVYVVHRERQVSIEVAIDYVIERHDSEVAEFQRLCHELPVVDPQFDLPIRHYVAGLTFWMRANMDWSTDTYRYRANTRT